MKTIRFEFRGWGLRSAIKQVAMVAACIPIAAAWGSTPEEVVEGWAVYKNGERKTCQMLTIFQNDEVLHVSYDATEKDTIISVTEKDATSLRDGDKRTLSILFLKGNNLDDGWEDVEFQVALMRDGKRLLSSQILNPPFLEDFAASSKIAFFVGEKKIDSYDLSGTAKAVTALRKCAMSVAGMNPADPFVQ
jgi:hypothetical protein